MGEGTIMVFKLKKNRTVKPTTIFGMTTLAFAASGLYASTAEAATTHTVQAGEFLEKIGQQYGVSIKQLRQWNNLQTDLLQIGQELIVAEPVSANDSEASSSGSTMVVTASRLNVRSGAGTNHSVIGGLNGNQTVTVTGSSNGWYTINHNGRTGYISADYVKEQTGSSSTSSTSASETMVVTVNSLNVRSGAGTNHSIIGNLKRNQTVTVTPHSNGWYAINHNGRTGYISAHFVAAPGSASNTDTSNSTSNSSDGLFIWPTIGGVVTSYQGPRWGSFHKGIDIAAPSDYTIIAAKSGKVSFAGWMNGYGNTVKIEHSNGYSTRYSHLSSIDVSVGQTVSQGAKIGMMGSTGHSTGIHLDFEVYQNGKLLNPIDVLPKR